MVQSTDTTDAAPQASTSGDFHEALPVQADYFAFGEVFKCFFAEKYGDSTSYVEHKTLNEGSRRKYLNQVNREVTLMRGSGDAKMKLASGDEKHLLLEEAIVGWNLVRADRNGDLQPVRFDRSGLQDFLSKADPKIIDVIEKDVRKHNPWLLAEVTEEGIMEQIKDLEETLEEIRERDRGNSTSSSK